QLLDHRGGPLHHLAGGDLVDERFGQQADRHDAGASGTAPQCTAWTLLQPGPTPGMRMRSPTRTRSPSSLLAARSTDSETPWRAAMPDRVSPRPTTCSRTGPTAREASQVPGGGRAVK